MFCYRLEENKVMATRVKEEQHSAYFNFNAVVDIVRELS